MTHTALNRRKQRSRESRDAHNSHSSRGHGNEVALFSPSGEERLTAEALGARRGASDSTRKRVFKVFNVSSLLHFKMDEGYRKRHRAAWEQRRAAEAAERDGAAAGVSANASATERGRPASRAGNSEPSRRRPARTLGADLQQQQEQRVRASVSTTTITHAQTVRGRAPLSSHAPPSGGAWTRVGPSSASDEEAISEAAALQLQAEFAALREVRQPDASYRECLLGDPHDMWGVSRVVPPLVVSGIPYGPSGLPLAGSGAPLAGSGAPHAGSGDPHVASGPPLPASGVPIASVANGFGLAGGLFAAAAGLQGVQHSTAFALPAAGLQGPLSPGDIPNEEELAFRLQEEQHRRPPRIGEQMPALLPEWGPHGGNTPPVVGRPNGGHSVGLVPPIPIDRHPLGLDGFDPAVSLVSRGNSPRPHLGGPQTVSRGTPLVASGLPAAGPGVMGTQAPQHPAPEGAVAAAEAGTPMDADVSQAVPSLGTYTVYLSFVLRTGLMHEIADLDYWRL
ncbi:hypothetical protein Esti_006835 [Eimeria stiedai]